MANPTKIQLAIQGGGAKIVSLLAAAEAIQGLEERNQLKVTRFAGTSAGAIVACLLAGGVRVSDLRTRVFQDLGAELKRAFPARGKVRSIYRVTRGKPLYHSDSLRRVLEMLFDGSGITQMKDLQRPVFITAANILDGNKQVYSSEKDAEKPVVSCLEDSCGLPFVFRAPKSQSIVVDGGICENLPSDELVDGQEKFGKIVGISFTRGRASKYPTNVLSFSRALLDTAMANSMDRARKLIGDSAVYSIGTSIKTFDV